MPPNDRPLHPGSACLPCRKRKAKCDGVRPLCGRCKRLGSNCAFDPPNKQHAGRTASLELSSVSPPSGHDYLSPTTHSRSSHYGPPAFQRLLSKIPDDNRLEQLSAGWHRPNLPIYLYREGWEHNFTSGQVTRTMYPEAYETCIPRATVEATLLDWDTRYEPTLEITDYLVRLFLPYRRHFYFFLDIGRLLRGIYLPQSDPDAIHPALLNVIYLITCQLVKGDLSRHQAVLLSRARAYMDDALARVDRITQFLTASLMLSVWYGLNGRLIEAQQTVATTVQFGVACGLHDPSDCASIILPLGDTLEMTDRKNLWYGICMADNCLSFGLGLPRVVPEKGISSIDYLANEALSDMFQFPSTPLIRTRTNVLLYAVRNHVQESKNYPGSPIFTSRGAQLSHFLSTFANSLPPIDSPDGIAFGENISLANPDFVISHLDICAATILLLNSRLDKEPMAYEKVFKSASAIASLGKHLRSGGRLELLHASPSYMLAVHTACEVLVRDITRCNADPDPASAQRSAMVEIELEALLNFEVELMVHFPARRWVLRKMRGIMSGTDTFESI